MGKLVVVQTVVNLKLPKNLELLGDELIQFAELLKIQIRRLAKKSNQHARPRTGIALATTRKRTSYIVFVDVSFSPRVQLPKFRPHLLLEHFGADNLKDVFATFPAPMSGNPLIQAVRGIDLSCLSSARATRAHGLALSTQQVAGIRAAASRL